MKPALRKYAVCLVALCGLIHAQETAETVGVGMVKPRLVVGETLEFWPPPTRRPAAFRPTPVGSITLGEGDYGTLRIASAPPGFAPEIVKLDYDILLLRARSMTSSHIEVVVNRETGRTAWVERSAVEFLDWPSFWLSVFAIEVKDLNTNPVRTKPLDHAARVLSAKETTYGVQAVRGNWLQVGPAEASKAKPIGWIRWQDGEQILIGYFLLS